mmetsp:Transcript_24792/g.44101  ORF Transcript_24792/g.44101 Transcript_24792/m.44101 type:complete len:90 (+) Transcript_24792:339-608(+)
MGRIKLYTTKSYSKGIINFNNIKVSKFYTKNKKICEMFLKSQSKKLRNKIAGFINILISKNLDLKNTTNTDRIKNKRFTQTKRLYFFLP